MDKTVVVVGVVALALVGFGFAMMKSAQATSSLTPAPNAPQTINTQGGRGDGAGDVISGIGSAIGATLGGVAGIIGARAAADEAANRRIADNKTRGSEERGNDTRG